MKSDYEMPSILLMGDLMKDDKKTKKQLIDELTGLRSQNAALEKSESAEKYRSLVENIRDVIYELDSQGVVLYISPAVRDMLGYSSAEIVGKHFTELAYKDDLSRLEEWFSELRKGRESPSEYRVSDKSGEIKWAQTKTRPIMEDGLFKGARGILIDVTAQKRMAEALLKSEEKFRTIFDRASDGILIADPITKKFLQGNTTICSMLGYTKEEIENLTICDIHPPKDISRVLDEFKKMVIGEIVVAEDLPVLRKDGSIFYADISAAHTTLGGINYLIGIFRDISERKKAEEVLRDSEEKYRSLIENANEAIFVAQDGKLVFLNPMTAGMTGYSTKELMAKPFIEFIHPDDREMVVDRHVRRMKGEGLAHQYPFRIIHRDGSVRSVELNAVLINWNGKAATLNFMSDITDRKRAEDALKESEERYRSILEEIEDGYQEVDLSGNFTFFNKSFRKIFGYSENELMGSNFRRYAADEENADKVYRAYNQMFKTGDPLKRFEWDIITKAGARRSIEFFASLLRDGEGRRRGFRGIVRDVTDRKIMEDQYRTMANSSQTGVYIVQDGKLCFVNPHIPNYSGYSEEELIGEWTMHFVYPDDRDMVRKMAGKMLAGNLTASYEYRIVDKNNQVKWLMETVTSISYKGRSAVLGNTMDVTERKQAEENFRETLERLRKAVDATIQVMVSAVEARDPYTAGHQIRSANLARAIATEMGLPQEKIDGIRMAGSIHDIGKLSIPAEILSKPTKLTNIEFSLIKEHARQGYEMLKDVESPWPLAEIVHQHHERMDGSGYPRNLKGDDILMEARIMAVADVVESMASHRPYRPALGIEPALEEIEKNKGILYDDAVADACLRLFREKGFQLHEA